MATKKQKHEAALARREAFLEEQRLTGLKALKKDQEHRARKLEEATFEAERRKREQHLPENNKAMRDIVRAIAIVGD